MQVIESIDALSAWVGREVALSDWLLIDQHRIQLFADATGDQQWIHIDPERARRESPYKSTIAHGFLTVSTLPYLFESCLRIDGVGMAINYGLDRVRLPAPVLANQRVRARLVLDRLDPVAGGVQAHWSATIEIENGSKPACVAQMLVRYYPTAAHTDRDVTRTDLVPR
ncbi:MAG: MaoC family dehydratase [Dokdonella sp.]